MPKSVLRCRLNVFISAEIKYSELEINAFNLTWAFNARLLLIKAVLLSMSTS